MNNDFNAIARSKIPGMSRRHFSRFGLLVFLLIPSGCDRILGPRHSVLIRLDDPAYRHTAVPASPDEIIRARNIMELRLDLAGAGMVRNEPIAGDPRQLRITFRGNFPAQRIRALLGNAGRLEFSLAASDKTWSSREEAMKDADIHGVLPPGTALFPCLINDEHPIETWYLLESATPFTDADLRSAQATTDQSQRPAVGFTFNVEAGARFLKFTEQNMKKKLAIILNGRIVTVPMIESPIGANGIIHGSFTDEEVEAIVEQLNSGGMPLQPVILEMK